MTPLRFAFVLHVHQPVGNFDVVFREHADEVYRPFLDFLEQRALWPIGLHVSGPLLEWLGEHDRALHDRIGRLSADGKAELLSAGWYEPILASLPRPDRATQLGWMREELEGRFGATPEGLWLTERVWAPELAADLADAGITYTLLDDHLGRRAGATDRELLGRLRAEHEGRGVDVLSIDEGLRYLIPFKPAAEVAADLRRRHAAGDPLALFADDGEKFGGWPRTREWLYDRGWIEAFGDQMDALRADDVVRMVTPGRAREELDPGRVLDFPVGAYAEMEEWAGGPWSNFLDRYEEAGRLHRWMTELSEAARAADDPEALRRAVGRAQCNDPYWHGVFGGLYMKHLREGVRGWMAVAERLLRGGRSLEWVEASERDGSRAHRVASPRLYARVSGVAGGTLTELVWLAPHVDVTDYLTRRLEAYHEEAVVRGRARPKVDGDGGAATERSASGVPASRVTGSGLTDRGDSPETASIHEIEEAATLERLPPTDPEVRVLVRDRVLAVDVTPEAYRHGTFEAWWMPEDGPLMEPRRVSGGGGGDAGEGVALEWSFPAAPCEKTLLVADDRVEIAWRWDASAFPPDAWFAPELSLARPVTLSLEPEPAETWRYPVVTVSKCPNGFEEIEQGMSVTPRWPVEAGRAKIVIRPATH